MSDKPIIQQQLSETISSLVVKVPREGVMEFISTFWETMCAEWNGIDRLRYVLESLYHIQYAPPANEPLCEQEYRSINGPELFKLIHDPLIF
jgi:hypothetical protein